MLNLKFSKVLDKNTINQIYEEIEIDISNFCNLECPLCHRNNFGEESYKLNSKNLDAEDFKRIFEVFPNLKKVFLGFMVSEPTLNPNFLDIVKYIKSKNKSIVLSTNGNTFATDSDRSNQFWKNLMDHLDSTDKIIWPIDGFSEDIYQLYRINGKLEKVIKNIKRATALNPEVDHTIQTIIFKHNQEDINKNYEKFKEDHEEVFHQPNWSLIDCCGDCATLSDEVQPVWDKNQWIKIKTNPPRSPKGFECESLNNKIVFVDHELRIGFCPTQLTNSVITKEVPTIYEDIETINKYCYDTYTSKHQNKICQFNCGPLSKLFKEKAGIDGIPTK